MERIPYNGINPEVYQHLRGLGQYVASTDLDIKLLELLRYRVSQINNCAFCLDMHFKEAVAAGEDAKRLYSVSAWRETPYYTDAEQAALAFAEALTLVVNGGVDDSIFTKMEAHYSKKQIADFTIAVSVINTWNRITNVTRMVPGNYVVGQFA